MPVLPAPPPPAPLPMLPPPQLVFGERDVTLSRSRLPRKYESSSARSTSSPRTLIRLLRFGRLPLARIPRTENGVDHRHVFECILKRNRHVSISANCSGEDVALNRVLVADREV